MKSRQKSFRCGIIGGGNIAWRYDHNANNAIAPLTHRTCLVRHPKTELVAIFEPNPQAYAELRHEIGGDHSLTITDSLTDFFSLGLDLVSVCSPTKYHKEHIELALENEIKYIWAEKPVTASLAELESILSHVAIVENRARISVNFFRRHLAAFARIKAHLTEANGAKMLEFRYSRDLVTNGVHLLDILGYFFDDCFEYKIEFAVKNSAGNPVFGLRINDCLITFVGNTLPYHLIELTLTTDNGRLSVNQNGKALTVERKKPNQDYPGFYELGDVQHLEDIKTLREQFNWGMYKNLSNLVAIDEPIISSIHNSLFPMRIFQELQELNVL
jgi:hypothetical protein